MERIRDRLREAPVGGDHRRDVERLHAHDDVVEVERLEDRDLAQREVDHALSLVAQLPGPAVADGAVVHADADRRLLVLRALHHLADAVLVVQVARVQAELVDAGVQRHECQAVVEVDVRDDRQDRPANELLQRLPGALVRDGHARDLAAGFLELLDLADRRVEVVGERRAHRLHRDGRAVADGRAAHPDALARPPRARADAVLREVEVDAHRGQAHAYKGTPRVCLTCTLRRVRPGLVRELPFAVGLVLALLVLFAFGFAERRAEILRIGDFSGFWAGARALLLGLDPYDSRTWLATTVELGTQRPDTAVYGYPPHVALALLPLALLRLEAAAAVWAFATMTIAAFGVRALLRTALPDARIAHTLTRSEERRVGKGGRSRREAE